MLRVPPPPPPSHATLSSRVASKERRALFQGVRDATRQGPMWQNRFACVVIHSYLGLEFPVSKIWTTRVFWKGH